MELPEPKPKIADGLSAYKLKAAGQLPQVCLSKPRNEFRGFELRSRRSYSRDSASCRMGFRLE